MFIQIYIHQLLYLVMSEIPQSLIRVLKIASLTLEVVEVIFAEIKSHF